MPVMAPPVFGALADATSLHLAVTVLAAFPVAGLVLGVRLHRPRPGAAGQTPPAVPPRNSAPRL
jgi:hypothetical protein